MNPATISSICIFGSPASPKRIISSLAAVAALALIAACGSTPDSPNPTEPQRIVSLSPVHTEMLFAIGAGAQVVAVDELSNYPAAAPRTTLSGYTPNAEAVADPARQHAMEDVLRLLQGALAARTRCLIKLNVAGGDLDKVLEVLPSMKAPTITDLADSDYHGVEAVVEKPTVNRLIPVLKTAGAFDIIELTIAKIVS